MATFDETNPDVPVVVLSPGEMARCDELSTQLMRQHYQEGVAREECDRQWMGFLRNHLLGPALYERVSELGERVGWRVLSSSSRN